MLTSKLPILSIEKLLLIGLEVLSSTMFTSVLPHPYYSGKQNGFYLILSADMNVIYKLCFEVFFWWGQSALLLTLLLYQYSIKLVVSQRTLKLISSNKFFLESLHNFMHQQFWLKASISWTKCMCLFYPRLTVL